MPTIRLTVAVLVLAGLLTGCGPNRAELARLAPYGAEPREPCGETTRWVSLRDLGDEVEGWSVADARDELGPPQLASDEGGIKRAGWYDVTIGQKNCGTLLTILERDKQRIVTVQDLKPHEIWTVLDGKFPK